MTRFRPCIDLHAGQVKQIVGGTLTTDPSQLRTNFTSSHSAGHFADLYRTANCRGSHIIMLGPGNEDAARQALQAWPDRLQVGGGINPSNAADWIQAGAEKIIVTSYLFPDQKFSIDRLQSVLDSLEGRTDRLVIDLSCRRVDQKWWVAMDRWQTMTEMEVNAESIKMLEPFCSEFLVHAADHEGLQAGLDLELVRHLADWCSIPVTYAGGARSVRDLDQVKNVSRGRVDLTIGSALDVFGGDGCTFDECCQWNKMQEQRSP